MEQTRVKITKLNIRRVFDAPRERVWKAWTEPERMKQWWGPEGFTTPFARIDLRVGGEYLYDMRSPEGKDFWGKGIFKEIDAPRRLIYTDSFADEKGNTVSATYYGMSPDFPIETLVTITLEEIDGKTGLTLEGSDMSGIPEKDFQDMEKGWNQMFNKLAAYLRKT